MLMLDTSPLLWHLFGSPRLGPAARARIDAEWRDANIAVSAYTFLEIAMLRSKGRIDAPPDVMRWRNDLLSRGIVEIPLDGATAVRAYALENFHNDPADRVITAAAMDGHTLLTSDERILIWPGNLNRLDARK